MVLSVAWMKIRFQYRQLWTCQIIERVPKLTILADPKPKPFLRRPTMVSKNLCPLSKKILVIPLQLHSFIKIEYKIVCYKNFSNKQINYASNFFDRNDEIKSWQKRWINLSLKTQSYFKRFRLLHAIRKSRKLASAKTEIVSASYIP